jgi:hypothetical protein
VISARVGLAASPASDEARVTEEDARTLQELLGDDFEVRSGTHFEVFGPDKRVVGRYEADLDLVFAYARVLFNNCNDQSESFLLELGRRVISDRSDEITERGFEITDDDSITFDDAMGRECPYYTVGLQKSAESLDEVAEAMRELYESPIEYTLDVGVTSETS